ncbi:MAG: signal peptidase I [Clostridiales Family XIII bacterium]|jgi:signal peptidase I|nr:signal peptidase I [Clostridiales Family XIII bacterium]
MEILKNENAGKGNEEKSLANEKGKENPEIKNKEIIVEEGDKVDTIEGGKRKVFKIVLTWVIDIAVAVLLAFIIMQFFSPTIVKEQSMDNTLHENDYLILATKVYKFHKIQHGDIIVFKSDLPNESNGKKNLIKRVIGLPGDTIEIKDEKVVRNGKVLQEKYTKDGYTSTNMAKIKVPKGKLFCMGDNRAVSLDSRDSSVGLVSEKNVVGKAIFRIFPFSRFGGIYKYKE